MFALDDYCIKRREFEGSLSAPTNHGGLQDTFLLYHRVKWACHAKKKDILGQEVSSQGAAVVLWIQNSSPFCILELKKANYFMKTDEFKECISKDFTELEDADEMLVM